MAVPEVAVPGVVVPGVAVQVGPADAEAADAEEPDAAGGVMHTPSQTAFRAPHAEGGRQESWGRFVSQLENISA